MFTVCTGGFRYRTQAPPLVVASSVSATSNFIETLGISVALGVYGAINETVNVNVYAPSVFEIPLALYRAVKLS